MSFLNFQQFPFWINLACFATAAVVVWMAGTRVSGYAAEISDRTGIGGAFIGLILLAGITSLPELGVSVTASSRGEGVLAVSNILGGVAMQVAIIAIGDAILGKDAISSAIADPAVLLQGAMGIMLLILVSAGIVVGDFAILGVGLWTFGLLLTYLIFVWVLSKSRNENPSAADGSSDSPTPEMAADSEEAALRRVVIKTVTAGAIVLVSGYVLARSGESIAGQTGLGTSFVGATLLAIATSLPEVSTVVAAVRIRRYEMAYADIFGTNLFDLILIFLIDAMSGGGAILDQLSAFALFAALLGIAVTAVAVAGLIEKKNRVVLRMGYDALVIILLYCGGIVILYTLR